MKMSKSFSLPVETARPYNETEVRDGVGDYVLSADDSVDLEAVCVAINMHDELVEALDLMCDELNKLVLLSDNSDLIDISVLQQAEKSLKEAKS